MSSDRSAKLVAALVILTGCAAIVSAAPLAARSASPVERVTLRASQVGPGYVSRVIPGGRFVQGQVTLDMCGFRFTSEGRRVARLQTGYVRAGSKLALSNEVVSYRAGG